MCSFGTTRNWRKSLASASTFASRDTHGRRARSRTQTNGFDGIYPKAAIFPAARHDSFARWKKNSTAVTWPCSTIARRKKCSLTTGNEKSAVAQSEIQKYEVFGLGVVGTIKPSLLLYTHWGYLSRGKV